MSLMSFFKIASSCLIISCNVKTQDMGSSSIDPTAAQPSDSKSSSDQEIESENKSSSDQEIESENKSSKLKKCSPSSSYDDAVCTIEKEYSKLSKKSVNCPESGSGFEYGPCSIVECIEGFEIIDDKCVEISTDCTPDTVVDVVNCTDGSVGSIAAEMQYVCNEHAEVKAKPCIATECKRGYTLDGGRSTVVEIIVNDYGLLSETWAPPFRGPRSTMRI